MKPGEWFRVAADADEAAGQVILAGWEYSAVGSGPHADNPYYAVATCPRCGACCLNDDTNNGRLRGRAIRRHEEWHAATNYPIPAELQRQSR